MSNYRFINHLTTDIGKLFLINNFKEQICANYWQGIDSIKLDGHQYILSKRSRNDGTNGAKASKKKLIQKMINEKVNYLVLFEDDMLPSKYVSEFINNLDKTIINRSWKLIYLGVSYPVQLEENKVNLFEDIKLVKLPEMSRNSFYTGAYAVCIHCSVFNEILTQIDNPRNINKAFDVTCLGYIQKKYPNECFITNPQLCISDVTYSAIREARSQNGLSSMLKWNQNFYYRPRQIPLFILTRNNLTRIENSIYLLGILRPIILPVIVHIDEPNDETKTGLDLLQKQSFEYMVLRDVEKKFKYRSFVSNEFNNLIQNYYNTHLNVYNFYGITTHYINWSYSLGEELLFDIYSKFTNNKINTYIIPVHHNMIGIECQTFWRYNGFSFFRRQSKKLLRDIISSETSFYNIFNELDVNSKYALQEYTVTDITEEINQYQQTSDDIWYGMIMKKSLLFNNKKKWCERFIRVWHSLFQQKIRNCMPPCELRQITLSDVNQIPCVYRSSFRYQVFILNKLEHIEEGNNIKVQFSFDNLEQYFLPEHLRFIREILLTQKMYVDCLKTVFSFV